MGLKLIGAGLGRTGTDSLRNALHMLGYGPCHHMFVLRDDPENVPAWMNVAKGESTPDWDAIFEGFQAQVDFPGAAYWKELSEFYPNAKLVLTVRDSDSWYASIEKTLLQFIKLKGTHKPAHRNDTAELTEIALRRTLDCDPFDEVAAKAGYEAHNKRVQTAIPSDRLLVLPLGSGWEPLCTFLERPVPDEPYPSGNTTTDFTKYIELNRTDVT